MLFILVMDVLNAMFGKVEEWFVALAPRCSGDYPLVIPIRQRRNPFPFPDSGGLGAGDEHFHGLSRCFGANMQYG
jgi:hypothetical protein